jgi:hypothetical protein
VVAFFRPEWFDDAAWLNRESAWPLNPAKAVPSSWNSQQTGGRFSALLRRCGAGPETLSKPLPQGRAEQTRRIQAPQTPTQRSNFYASGTSIPTASRANRSYAT